MKRKRSELKINEEVEENKDLTKLSNGINVIVDEKIYVSLSKHEFEYVGWNNVHRCKNCGLEIPIGDMRIFEYAEAKKLAEVLAILDKNDFQEWESREVEDFKTLASGGTNLVSTGRVESAYNEIRYGRASKPNDLRR